MRKSQLVGLLLTLVFGPFGLAYASTSAFGWFIGAMALLLVSTGVLGMAALGPLLIPVFWPASMIASVVLIGNYNRGLGVINRGESTGGMKVLAFDGSFRFGGGTFDEERSLALWRFERDKRFEVRLGDRVSRGKIPPYDRAKLVFMSYGENEARDFYDRFLLAPKEMLASPWKPKYDKPLAERD